MLGISSPRAPRICPACGSEHVYSHNGQCIACKHAATWARIDAAIAKLSARVGPVELVHREDAPLARRWELRFERDGDPIALCADPLEAVEAGEELL
mgnify:CR=1 FL=1